MIAALENITIYNPIGGTLCTLPVTDSCERSNILGGENKVTISVKLAERYVLPAFAFVAYDGELFFLKELYTPQPQGGYYTYNVSFYSVLNLLDKPLFRRYVEVDGESFNEPQFSINANLGTLGELVIEAVNKYSLRVPKYNNQTTIFAQCIATGNFVLNENDSYDTTTLQSFAFESSSIADAINTIVEPYDTEYWLKVAAGTGMVPKYTLMLERCESTDDIIYLNDTFDNATRKSGGLTKAEYSGEFGDIPQVVLPIGSDRNITRKVAQQTIRGNLMNVSYAKCLKLDPDTTYSWTDDSGNAISLTTNSDGALEVDGVTTGIETTETFDDIYPKGEFEVTEVATRGDKENPYYKIMFEAKGSDAPDFPFTIGEGLTLSIIFESGLLNGMEFECEQGNGGNGKMGLTIIPNGDDDSAQIPYGAFVPKVGDKFAVFNIVMPDSYIESAKTELAKECYKKVVEYRDTRPDLSCTSEPNYFHENGVTLALGSRVSVNGELIAAEYLSRVSELSFCLTTPDKVSFKLSSAIVAGSLSALRQAIGAATNSVNGLQQKAITLSRRGWRDQKELSEMISSLASEMMLVGNEKYQFGLTCTISIINDSAGAFSAIKMTAGALEHTQEPYRDNGKEGVYEMPAATYYKSNISGYNASTPYYVYAVLNSSTAKGTWLITPTAQDGEYYMLVGVLASEFENQRTFSRTYGYTAITGGKVTTEMIQDANSNLIIDFASKPPRIVAQGGAEIIGDIRFKATDTKTASEYISDLEYLKENLPSAVTKGVTDINGGLVLSNVMAVRNESNAVRGGISGVNDVAFWAGDTWTNANTQATAATTAGNMNSATLPFLVTKAGLGKIGIFRVNSEQVVVDVPSQGKIVIDGSTSNQGIYIQDTDGIDKAVITPRAIKGSDFPKDDDTSTGTTYTISASGILTGQSGSATSNSFVVRSATSNEEQTQTITKKLSGTATFSMYIKNSDLLFTTSGSCVVQAVIIVQGNSMLRTIKVISKTITTQTGSTYFSGSCSFSNTNMVTAGSRTLSVTVKTAINGSINSLGIVESGAAVLPLYSGTRAMKLSATYSDTIVTQYIYKPKTIIGKDGIVCALSKDCYFMTRLNGSSQQIFFRGLPTTTTGLETGQIYNDGGTLKIKT